MHEWMHKTPRSYGQMMHCLSLYAVNGAFVKQLNKGNEVDWEI